VWWNGLHDIPDGLLLGVPTGLVGLARSSLLSRQGKLRAASEVLRGRHDAATDSIGAYVRARFGDEVNERLVDPLIGSIYAADTDDFSLAAVPQLAELATRSRSVLLSARRPPAIADGPVFYAPTAGMGALVAAVAAAVVGAGGELRCDAAVSGLAIDGTGWRVDDEAFDGVVLACPARVAGQLLATIAPRAAATLTAVPTVGVAVLTLAIPTAVWPARLHGLSGYLVPKPQQRLVTAASFGSQKWAHWASPDHVVLRVSLGRDGLPALHLTDDELLTEVLDELRVHLGIDAQPSAVRTSRWPNSFPQYRPHHGTVIAVTERSLPHGLALAGASYHGIGVPACIRSAQQAATRLLQR
jgi:oxygen-dependent protoporphyrinogen oxidase